MPNNQIYLHKNLFLLNIFSQELYCQPIINDPILQEDSHFLHLHRWYHIVLHGTYYQHWSIPCSQRIIYVIVGHQLSTIHSDFHCKIWPLTHEYTRFTQTQQQWEVSIALEHNSWTEDTENLESSVRILQQRWDFWPSTVHLPILCLILE